MVEDVIAQDENLRLAELRFKAARGDSEAAASLKKELTERKALPFYQLVATELVSSVAHTVSRRLVRPRCSKSCHTQALF